MRGKKARAIRRMVYGKNESRRNPGRYMWQSDPPGGKRTGGTNPFGGNGGLVCAGKRGTYQKVKRMVKRQGLRVNYDGSQTWVQEG